MQEISNMIQDHYSDLPPAQQQVASYVLSHYKEIPFLSVTSLAREIGVSDTTIIKFCMQIGFDGFGSFKRKLAEYVQSEMTMYGTLEHSIREIGDQDTLDSVLAQDMINLQNTLNNPINRSNFESFIECIERANNIYIIGFRTSATLAEYFALTLGQQDRNVQCIVPGLGEYADKLCKMRPGDLLIAVTFKRYSTEVVQAIQFLKQQDVTCCLITDGPACPVYNMADVALTCETTSSHYSGSYVGCFSLMNAIITATSLKRTEKTTAYLRRLEDQFKSYRTFYR